MKSSSKVNKLETSPIKKPVIKNGDHVTFCFDSNIYINNPSLSNQDWTAFRSFIEAHTNSVILIPEVVLEEIKPKIKLRGVSAVKAQAKAVGECWNFGVKPTIAEKKKDLIKAAELFADNYEQYLKTQFSISVHKGSLKHIPTAELFERSLKGTKPFRNDGSDGFKDYLIWRSFLDFAKKKTEGHFIFITGNTLDFSHQTENDFHEDLKEDLKIVETKKRKFYFFKDMGFLTTLLPDVTSNIQNLNKTLEKDFEYSADEIANEGIGTAEVHLPGTNSDEYYINGYSISDIEVESVKRISSKTILVQGTANASLEYLYYANKSDVYDAEQSGASINEYDYNDHVSEMSFETDVTFKFGAEYSENKDKFNLVRYFINDEELVPGWTLL